MSSLASSRQRSQRFARLVETARGGPRHHGVSTLDASLAPLVCLCIRLGEYGPPPGPDPRFSRDLRSMLLATARRDGVGNAARAKVETLRATKVLRPLPRPARFAAGRTRTVVLVGVTAGALALSGVSTAGTDSLPGDPRYHVKRSAERAQLAMAGSDLHRGRLHLEFARNRMLEAAHLDSQHLRASVLADMDSATRLGVALLTRAAVARADLAALRTIEEFVAAQRARLAELLRTGPGVAVEVAHTCASLLAAADRRTKDLATALARGCALAPADELGPRARRC